MAPMSIIIFVLYVVEVSQATEIVSECKAKQKIILTVLIKNFTNIFKLIL